MIILRSESSGLYSFHGNGNIEFRNSTMFKPISIFIIVRFKRNPKYIYLDRFDFSHKLYYIITLCVDPLCKKLMFSVVEASNEVVQMKWG